MLGQRLQIEGPAFKILVVDNLDPFSVHYRQIVIFLIARRLLQLEFFQVDHHRAGTVTNLDNEIVTHRLVVDEG